MQNAEISLTFDPPGGGGHGRGSADSSPQFGCCLIKLGTLEIKFATLEISLVGLCGLP